MTVTGRRAVKKLLTAMMVVAVATPSYAQIMPNLMGGDGSPRKTDVEVKEEKAREDGFKSGLSKIPDSKAKTDPWGNVRDSAPATTQSAKTQSDKTQSVKTQSAKPAAKP